MSASSDIIAAIDAIILAKLTGASFNDLVDKSMGKYKITQSTTIKELRELRRDLIENPTPDDFGGTEIITEYCG